MLVLSRKEGQRIIIGSGIEIVVTQVCGNRVRLGITAPLEVPIHREEVHERLQPAASRQPALEFEPQCVHSGDVCYE